MDTARIVYTGYFRKSHRANWWLTCIDKDLERCKLLLAHTLEDAREKYPKHNWEGTIMWNEENDRDGRQAEFPCTHKFGDSEVIC
jgi:hypothetical protein